MLQPIVRTISRMTRSTLVTMLILFTMVATVLPAAAQSPEPQPAGEAGVGAKNSLFLPVVSANAAKGDPKSIVSSEELQSAATAKFNAMPISEAWFNSHQQWFEQFMAQQRLQSATAEELSMEQLEELASIPQSAEVNAFLVTVLEGNEVEAASSNNLDMSKARNGDILLGYSKWINLWGVWRHAATWDNGQTLHSPGQNNNVKRDSGDYFRNNFTLAAIMGVWWNNDSLRNSSLSYSQKQIGEPYDYWSWKFSEDKWYCSKLPWAGYYRNSPWWLRVDLDASGGYWVTPDDLWWSGWTYLRSFGR